MTKTTCIKEVGNALQANKQVRLIQVAQQCEHTIQLDDIGNIKIKNSLLSPRINCQDYFEIEG